MKKIAISTLLVLGSLTATARVLSPQEAINRAETSCNKAKIGAMTQLSPELMRTIGDSDGDPAVYVFKTGGAALVVSADDVATPLLGYVDAIPADNDNLPPQLDWWLKEYARQIEYAKANGMKVVANLDSGRDEIAPLCNTKWDQSTPYNSMCPPSGYGISMTGCVATAMAQVMKYHNWPERGTGISTYQDSWGQTFSMDMDVAFDWANMTNIYDETATQEQQDAVALLMVACGYAAKMNFDIYESSSNYSNAINGLKTYLGYSKGMRLLYRDFLDLHEWYDIIYDNLVNYGPILYAGESYNSDMPLCWTVIPLMAFTILIGAGAEPTTAILH